MAAETVNLADVDPERIAAELVKAEGNVHRAAKALGVRPNDLRRLTVAEPRLIEAALEAAELALDHAEAQLLKALRKGQLSNRLQAAAYIVRTRRR
jgi:acetyl-CoA carboxylase alpha subunit